MIRLSYRNLMLFLASLAVITLNSCSSKENNINPTVEKHSLTINFSGISSANSGMRAAVSHNYITDGYTIKVNGEDYIRDSVDLTGSVTIENVTSDLKIEVFHGTFKQNPEDISEGAYYESGVVTIPGSALTSEVYMSLIQGAVLLNASPAIEEATLSTEKQSMAIETNKYYYVLGNNEYHLDITTNSDQLQAIDIAHNGQSIAYTVSMNSELTFILQQFDEDKEGNLESAGVAPVIPLENITGAENKKADKFNGAVSGNAYYYKLQQGYLVSAYKYVDMDTLQAVSFSRMKQPTYSATTEGTDMYLNIYLSESEDGKGSYARIDMLSDYKVPSAKTFQVNVNDKWVAEFNTWEEVKNYFDNQGKKLYLQTNRIDGVMKNANYVIRFKGEDEFNFEITAFNI